MKPNLMTDEHALQIINAIHVGTENKLIERRGLFGLTFEESYRKYGDATIKFLRTSVDRFDGSNYCEWHTEIVFKHGSVWFAELSSPFESSNYNKNHYFGYLKLLELGYEMPEKATWI